jgi:hypothetical protein
MPIMLPMIPARGAQMTIILNISISLRCKKGRNLSHPRESNCIGSIDNIWLSLPTSSKLWDLFSHKIRSASLVLTYYWEHPIYQAGWSWWVPGQWLGRVFHDRTVWSFPRSIQDLSLPSQRWSWWDSTMSLRIANSILCDIHEWGRSRYLVIEVIFSSKNGVRCGSLTSGVATAKIMESHMEQVTGEAMVMMTWHGIGDE